MKRPSVPIPETPGSYQFKDGHGRVIYVGKAKNLRARLTTYFADSATLHPRTASMVEAAQAVEWIEVRNDLEAVLLEYSLIKEHKPRFNISMRDDKSFPFLAVTVDEEWPRAMVMRGRRRRGTRYFGPYVQAWAIRDVLDSLLRTFPVRTCSSAKFAQHNRLGRPCLLFHIEKCSGPCVNAVKPDDYAKHVTDLMRFLNGDSREVIERMNTEMLLASAEQDFERAARLRDRLQAVDRVLEKQQMVGGLDDDLDVFGIVEDELLASVQVFFVRKGRVVGRNGFVFDKVEDLNAGQTIDRILENAYGEEPAMGIPKSVLVPTLPESHVPIEEWLTQRRGSQVEVRVPQRGDKRQLQETVTHNAAEELRRSRLKRTADHNARSKALIELQEHLSLPEPPLRIECYDMAHLQGTDYVGSMVVLEDGLPAKREYRKFRIKGQQGNDDYAAMREVLTRRLSAYLAGRDSGAGDGHARPSRFAYPPQLILVDGGKGQLAVAEQVVHSLGLQDEIPVAALAKRFEEVFIPGRESPVPLPRGSEALFLLQVIRDEAHRFANTFHRQLRAKRMKGSALDGIGGLGPKRRQRLLDHFGGLAGLKRANLEDLLDLSWLPDEVAKTVYEALHR
jgi:excinuclease ABC subunit C